jgi:tripartite-type tricarboxylate transporter receptor subunit TctC
MTSRIFLALVTALFTLGAPWALRAQDYPNRPVTLVVPWPAGGTTDIGMRALASATERYLKQKIIIENRPGASGVLGPQQVAQNAAPDGYTLVQIPITVFRFPFMRKTTLDPATDLTYIIGVSGYTFGVVVRGDAPWKSFRELIDYARPIPVNSTMGPLAPAPRFISRWSRSRSNRASSGSTSRSKVRRKRLGRCSVAISMRSLTLPGGRPW